MGEKAEKTPGLHDGHRDRLRQKYLKDGIYSLNDHEILELMLFYAIPRRDTNETAHRLINACGSLSAVFDAPIDQLTDNGMPENAAVMLKFIQDFYKVYIEDKYYNNSKTYGTEVLINKLINSFLGLNEERVVLGLFDASGKELFFGMISKGSFHSSELNARRVTELALKYKAQSAIIAHNHPSGVTYPSATDISTTVSLSNALKAIGVKLKDHYIVSSTSILSFSSDPSLSEALL